MPPSCEDGISDCRKSNIMEKVAQINSTVKVSSTFSKVAGSRGGAPRRCPQTAKFPYFKKTEQGVRNAKAFRGEAYKTASPFYGTNLLNLQNVPVERFGQSNSTELLNNLHKVNIFFDSLYEPAVNDRRLFL